nr:hypothetical protein [Tanacetum cinerariifolium]
RAKAAVERAHIGAGLAEAGVFGRHGQVADYVQHVAAADGPAGHHRNHGLGDAANHLLQVEHVEAGHGISAHVAAVAAHALVAARAEGASALAGEDDDADVGAVAANVHGLNHFLHRERREGVVYLRPVDADFGNAPALGEENFLELLNRGPLDGFSHRNEK